MQVRLILFYLLFIPAVTLSQAVQVSAVDQARRIAQKTFDDEKFPGMAVAVSRGGELVWSEGFGYADIAERIPVDPARSLFRIGSVSKTLTAAGLMLLYQEGKIDLDAEIQTYVPEFPPKAHPVTVRQVASHTGGIRHYRGVEFASNIHYPTVRDGLDIFKDDPLLFEPGTRYAYSSYGWNLISAAMETAAGMDFLAFMDTRIFTPFGMDDTHAEDVNQDWPARVRFYSRRGDDKQNLEAMPVDNSYKWAGGGFISTAEDLIRFGQQILTYDLLTRETMTESWTSAILNDGSSVSYGIGWRTGEDKKGRKWVGHSGGSVGGTSMFLVFPEEQLIVVTLVNLSSARMGNLAFRIAEQFLSNE